MRTIDEVKDISNGILGQCYNIMNRDGYLQPVVFRFYSDDEGDKVEPQTFTVEDEEDRELIPVFLKSQAEKGGTEHLLMALTMTKVHKEDGKEIPADLEEAENKMDVLMFFLYTKDAVCYREVPYGKGPDGQFLFTDLGWQQTKELKGRISNPFNKG